MHPCYSQGKMRSRCNIDLRILKLYYQNEESLLQKCRGFTQTGSPKQDFASVELRVPAILSFSTGELNSAYVKARRRQASAHAFVKTPMPLQASAVSCSDAKHYSPNLSDNEPKVLKPTAENVF